MTPHADREGLVAAHRTLVEAVGGRLHTADHSHVVVEVHELVFGGVCVVLRPFLELVQNKLSLPAAFPHASTAATRSGVLVGRLESPASEHTGKVNLTAPGVLAVVGSRFGMFTCFAISSLAAMVASAALCRSASGAAAAARAARGSVRTKNAMAVCAVPRTQAQHSSACFSRGRD